MKHFHTAPHHFAFEPPEPPAAFGGCARAIALMKIWQDRCGHPKRLVAEQPVLIVPVLGRQCPGKLPGIARDAAGGNRQRSGVEGGYHKGYKESVGYLTWAMRISIL